MNEMSTTKAAVRKLLKDRLTSMTDADRHGLSVSACRHVATSPEFEAARVVMLYLSTPTEVDTAPLALKCW